MNAESLSPNYASWLRGFWQDLQPTSGRLHSALRITLATALALVLCLVWQMPFAAYGLYAVFLISRESLLASLRLGISVLLTASLVVAVELILIIASDNDPIARVLGISVIAFLAGMVIAGTSLPALGSSWGLLSITVIGFWEGHSPADTLVKNSLRLLAAFCLGIGCAVAVEYVFGVRSPANRLVEQFRIRYQALEKMFGLFASESDSKQRFAAASQVSRLAAAGQTGMMDLYNQIADRDLGSGVLPVGARVHITMLAELMDDSAAFGLQSKIPAAADSRRRCERVAEQCRSLIDDVVHQNETRFTAPPLTSHTLLDTVERGIGSILLMPSGFNDVKNRELIGVPSKKIPILIPGAIRNRSNVAFSLKLSFCATICYIVFHAVDWPGLSTSVITVMVAGLTTTGAMKQRFTLRFLGAVIGGLIFGLGTVTFLFPIMDSITSLVILVGAVAFAAGWTSGGPRFNYVGLQIAFSFYLVTLQGFGPSTALAPARDRVVGIIFALIVMWFVFDQLWPVRTVTAMRGLLSSVLQSTVSVFRLVDAAQQPDEVLRTTESLRDRVGKDIATLRTLSEAAEYEFGVDREQHIRASEVMVRIAVTAAGMIWNQLALLHHEHDADLIEEPGLVRLRRIMAANLNAMAKAIVQKTDLHPDPMVSFVSPSQLENEHFH